MADAGSDALLRDIQDFYLPRKLVEAIYARGEIPRQSQESRVGVGFIDIADYTFLSKFLSPMENQTLLNGLYTAFQAVLDRHGGYLNKLEGDSLMFQFDDVMDPRSESGNPEENHRRIVRELFFTCVEMQRVCALFNNASEAFLLKDVGPTGKKALLDALSIIRTLRERPDLSMAMSAFFQVRIRIGASLGEVTIGNFGPDGAKQWDIIGMPVIDAKRMEATSPVGGLRISAAYFGVLDSLGIADDYCHRFLREARALGSRYATLSKAEIFAFKKVVIHEKKGASYDTYSVQVDPSFPESIGRQVESLLDRGPAGAQRIVELLKSFRGNRHVVDYLEEKLTGRGVLLRKGALVALLAPKRAAQAEAEGVDLGERYSLYELFRHLGRHQDSLKAAPAPAAVRPFLSYDDEMAARARTVGEAFRRHKADLVRRAHFQEVLVPLFDHSLLSSLLEYQSREADGDLQEL